MEHQAWEGASYLVAVFGSLLLWANYALFGLIARRYAQVFGRATYSTLIITAPSGLLLYTLFLVLKATPVLDAPAAAAAAQWAAYLALLGSGLLCLLGTARFAAVLASVTRRRGAGGDAGAPGEA